MAPPQTPASVLALRSVAFVVIGAWLTVGPLVRGTLNQEHLFWLPRWEMFGKAGKNICDVRYIQHHTDGSKSQVDWIELLGRSRAWDDRKKNRIGSKEAAHRTGQQLCRRLGGDEIDLRMRLKCGSEHTWKRHQWGTLDLCSPEGRDKLGALR